MSGKKCEALATSIARNEVACVMGFNEPDQLSQSNLSVAKAIEWWPLLMELDVPLVSPGCVHPDREWMTEFMEEADRRKYRIDYVAVHSYGGPRRLRTIESTTVRP